jgi:hypothetical protein
VSVRPDFFIAGAPKCGTTALFEYLVQHPRVFMPPMKEPNFFCTDLRTKGPTYTEEQYQSIFAGAPASVLTGEASALYLYSQVAIERLMNYNPDAKVIVMLRNPVNAAQSLHAAAWGHRHENTADFEQAWRWQEARLSGQHMPAGWPDPATLQYGPIYRYAGQIKRLMSHVPPRQRLIIVYEEFFAAPAEHYAGVLRFLGLPTDGRTSFPVVNPAVAPKSVGLERLLRNPPRWVKQLYGPLRGVLRSVRLDAMSLRDWNLKPKVKPTLDPRVRDELECYFAADVRELEGLLSRTLWRTSSGKPTQSGSGGSGFAKGTT